jgi:hypothetical protein
MLRTCLVSALIVLASSLAAEERKVADKTAEIEAILETRAEMNYLDTPLGDVVTDLELRYGINIEIDVPALAHEGVGSDLPITKILKDVPLASALDLLLAVNEQTWVIDSDVLLITSVKDEPKYLQTKVYVVGDLDDGPEVIGGIVMQSLSPVTWQKTEKQERAVGSIAVHPKSKSLVVTHTSRMHRKIAKLLGDLRAATEAAAK